MHSVSLARTVAVKRAVLVERYAATVLLVGGTVHSTHPPGARAHGGALGSMCARSHRGALVRQGDLPRRLTLLNRGQLRPDHFEEVPGRAVHLNDAGRQTVIVAYQERKPRRCGTPCSRRNCLWGWYPTSQARLLARHRPGDLRGLSAVPVPVVGTTPDCRAGTPACVGQSAR